MNVFKLKLHFSSALLFCSIIFTTIALGHDALGKSGAHFDFRRSVVKIYVTYNSYNFHEPWQMKGQGQRQGSGCIIRGHRILTNAHIVSDATFIEVRLSGRAKRYTAHVDMVGHDSDLATITVEDKDFFKEAKPIAIGTLPHIEDEVTVYGFPQGGDRLSITKGVVSRVEHVNYAHSGAYLLACQIDAPINSGNSGGPVILKGKIAGVAFQALNAAQFDNIGYMVPAPVIKRFLRDIEDGQYEGVPELGLSMQKMENPDLRAYYIKDKRVSGALVTRISPDSPAEGILEVGDIIVRADGHDIANDGTIEFRSGERTYFGYLFQGRQLGDRITLTILRNGSLQDVNIALTQPIDFDRLVPNEIYDTQPSYYIINGLVFEKLTLNYLKEYGIGNQWALNAPTDLLNLYLNGIKARERMEVIVLVKVLADKSNIGYHSFIDDVVDRVDGIKVSSLKELVQILKDNSRPYHILEDIYGHQIVIGTKGLDVNNRRILKKYRINSDRSIDLK